MLGILFIVVCVFFGYELVSFLVPDTRRLFVAIAPSKKILSDIPDYAFKIPAGAITGIAIASFFTYYISLAFSYSLTKGQSAMLAGITSTSVIYLYLAFMFFGLNRKAKKAAKSNLKIPEFKTSTFNIFFYGIASVLFTSVASFIFFYTYRINNGMLYNGFSVFSDLAPHTAMTSSFGVGSNFPTQYIHFSGDGIQYHFFFYFFCGVLQYLGLPIDYAINLPSIIAMVCTFTLLGTIAVLFSGRKMTYVIAPVLVLFRSAFNVFDSFKTMNELGYNLSYSLKTLATSTAWFDQSPYDSWGVWAINVYANQRHLLFGMALILILIILFIPYVRRLCISLMNKDNNVFKTFFIDKNAWLPRKNDPLHPIRNMILACILVIIMPYIHGSALIAALLVLFGMAIVSENRLSYLAVAVSAVIASFIQTRVFSGNYKDFVLFNFVSGFVSEADTTAGVLKYLIYITGFTLILTAVFAIGWLIKDIVTKKPVYRSLLVVAFLFPLIFAFNVQVSLEMLANHKFIQISLILVDIFVATVISNLIVLPFKPSKKEVTLPTLLPLNNEEVDKQMNSKGVLGDKPKGFRVPLPAFIPMQVLSALVAVCLLIGLVGTGVAEWCTFVNLNKNAIMVDTNSEVANWIKNKTAPDDVFLTPMWYTNRFFLAGRPTYYGWPYYAWSAGHDTYTRDEIYFWLVGGCNNNIDEFVRYCKEREIKYLLYDPEFNDLIGPDGEYAYNAEFFANNLKQVAYFPDDYNTIIYQIY